MEPGIRDAVNFWLVPNPINRYDVSSHDGPLVYGADGSLALGRSPPHWEYPGRNIGLLLSPGTKGRIVLEFVNGH